MRTWIVTMLTSLLVVASGAGARASGSSTTALADRIAELAEGPLRGLMDEDAVSPTGYAVAVEIPGWPKRGARLVELFDGLLRDRLARATGGRAIALAEPAVGLDMDAARAAAQQLGAGRVVLVTLSEQEGYLAAAAEVARGRRGFWERASGDDPGVRAVGFARARIDAELRTLLEGRHPRASHLAPRLTPHEVGGRPSTLVAEPLAVAVCDIDADGLADLAALSRDEVAIWAFGAVAPIRVGLETLERSATPSRAPYGSLLPVESATGPALLVSTSDIAGAHLLTLGPDGAASLASAGLEASPLARAPLEGPGAVLVSTARAGQAVFDTPVALWEPGAKVRPAGIRTTGPVTALDRVAVKLPAVGAHEVLEASRDVGGHLTVERVSTVDRARWELGARGVAFLLVDLDDDGEAEAVVTSKEVGGPDRITVLRLGARGAVTEVFAQDLAPVRALAAGDLDDDGALEVVAAVAPAQGPAALIVLRPGATPP
jgi:hypothetical protein